MKLFYQFEKPDPQKIIEDVKKAYGVKNPGKINGFMGTFLAAHLDVFVTDEVAKKAERSNKFREFLDNCITRFYHDDYGYVTWSESMNNGENRYLAGSTSWMIARYSFETGRAVVYANLYDMTLISFIEEDVSEIYEEQFRKTPYCTKGTLDDWFLNELRYVRPKSQ